MLEEKDIWFTDMLGPEMNRQRCKECNPNCMSGNESIQKLIKKPNDQLVRNRWHRWELQTAVHKLNQEARIQGEILVFVPLPLMGI